MYPMCAEGSPSKLGPIGPMQPTCRFLDSFILHMESGKNLGSGLILEASLSSFLKGEVMPQTPSESVELGSHGQRGGD